MNPRKCLSILTIMCILVLTVAVHAQAPDEVSSGGPRIYLRAGDYDPVAESQPAGLPAPLRALDTDEPGAESQIVQFYGPVTAEDRELLVSNGVEILDYLPDYAFVVRMENSVRSSVQTLPDVRWVGSYRPAYRLSPDLYASIDEPDSGALVKLAVDIFKGEDLDPLISDIKSLGGIVTEQSQTEWKSKLMLSLPAGQLLELASIQGIRWIEPAPEWQFNNDVAVGIMNVRDVWNTHGLYGNGQTVGICDSGLDKGSTSSALLHDDFENGSGVSRVTTIIDVAGDGAASDVRQGHGTHVAGSVLGNGKNSGSTPSTHTYPDTAYVGVAPEANLVFQASEVNTTGAIVVPSDLNDLFAQAAANGADLHTNSWGSPGPGAYTSSSSEVDEYIWDHPDFAILYSAGNEGTDSNADGVVDLGAIGSPGTAKNTITIGASESLRPSISWATWGTLSPEDFPTAPITDDLAADNAGGMAAFSSRGPTLDGRIKPDLVAPGTFIISTRSSLATGTGWGLLNDYYFYMGGTSMSTPLAAGAATIVRQYYTDLQMITPSAALIKATLINGAADIYPGQYPLGPTQEILSTRPTFVAGWGRVDLENSLYPDGGRTLSARDQKTGLETGDIDVYTYTVTNASQPFKVTLAWSDYPASPAASPALVNDLDLTVYEPGPTLRNPVNGAADRLNNVEGVDVLTPKLGVYTIVVNGFNVPQGPQPYALVVSGILGNTAPTIDDLPDQLVTINESIDKAIDLWAFTWDPQSPVQDLTFNIVNSTDPDVINAGVTLDSNRYIDLAPVQDWTGEVTVEISAYDGEKTGTNSFKVTVSDIRKIFLPLLLKNYPEPLKAGYWESVSGYAVDFKVVQYNVEEFAVYVSVPQCGIVNRRIVHSTPALILDYQFSFSGTFFASGTFDTLTSASGTFGLNGYYIEGCGKIGNGAVLPWTAYWKND